MAPESSSRVLGLEDWHRQFASFYEIAIPSDRSLLDELWLQYALHAHFAGRKSDGQLLREDVLDDQRAGYIERVGRIRATLTFSLLSRSERERLEAVAFAFPADKFGIKGRPAEPRLILYTPTYRELCEVALWPHVTDVSLMALMQKFPGRKISFCELDIEHYPPDGFDTERAFFSYAAASKCAKWITTAASRYPYVAFRTRIRPVHLVLDADGKIRLDDIEGAYWSDHDLKLLNGLGEFGWRATIKTYLGPGAIEPDFEAESENDTRDDSDEYQPA